MTDSGCCLVSATGISGGNRFDSCLGRMDKNIEVYDELFPWMIGQKVEIGVYERDEASPAESGDIISSSGGVLASYAVDQSEVGATQIVFVGYSAEPVYLNIPSEFIYLISVVESNRTRPV